MDRRAVDREFNADNSGRIPRRRLHRNVFALSKNAAVCRRLNAYRRLSTTSTNEGRYITGKQAETGNEENEPNGSKHKGPHVVSHTTVG